MNHTYKDSLKVEYHELQGLALHLFRGHYDPPRAGDTTPLGNKFSWPDTLSFPLRRTLEGGIQTRFPLDPTEVKLPFQCPLNSLTLPVVKVTLTPMLPHQ